MVDRSGKYYCKLHKDKIDIIIMMVRHRNNIKETDMTNEEIHEQQDKELCKQSTFTFDYLLPDFCSKMNLYGSAVYNSVVIIINIAGIYVAWILLHYIASQCYITFCVPNTVYGFVMSPFLAPAPHCQGLRWAIYNGANVIGNMWIVLGTWLCCHVLRLPEK